ncbi:MAG: RecQ family ATP-dependent DNA helicase [Bacteroidota bacterium]
MQRSPRAILQKYWGYTDFKGSQEIIITTLLEGKNVMALLPTGGGKSACYQIPALVLEGLCVVVSPLVALIHDQVSALKAKGVKAVAITAGIPLKELDTLLDNCIYGKVKFLYLSPERLEQGLVQERIRSMNVSIIAIDEAHCISEWGHDFRPAYRKCSVLQQIKPKAPLIALTATATDRVVQDVLENLQIPEAKVFRDSFARNNIAFSVRNIEDKRYQLLNLFQDTTASGIVYVRRRRDTIALSRFLNTKGKRAVYFHGGLSALEKKEKLIAWLSNDIQIMVATNAFGMGVDKPDVRLVVHYQLPESIENYFQEAGRAGRDGNSAKAVLLTNNTDRVHTRRQFLETLPDLKFIKELYRKLCSSFQIAYGERPEEVFGVNLDRFCQRYQLPSSKTWSALRLLDQNGVLALLQSSRQNTILRITASKEALFRWLDRNQKKAGILQVLLRTYGGLFDYDTKINLPRISKKTGIEERLIMQTLEQLHKDDMAIFTAHQDDLQIAFLAPREDDATINAIAKPVQQLNQTKQFKLERLLDYAENSIQCRTLFLLQYFGENVKKECGQCDICIAQEQRDSDCSSLEIQILRVLSDGEKTSRILATALNVEEKELLQTIRKMLADGKLILRQQNKYGIKN